MWRHMGACAHTGLQDALSSLAALLTDEGEVKSPCTAVLVCGDVCASVYMLGLPHIAVMLRSHVQISIYSYNMQPCLNSHI